MSASDNLQGELFKHEEPLQDVTKTWVGGGRGGSYYGARWSGNGAPGGQPRWHASTLDAIPTTETYDLPVSQDKEDWNSRGGHPLGIHLGSAVSASERARVISRSAFSEPPSYIHAVRSTPWSARDEKSLAEPSDESSYEEGGARDYYREQSIGKNERARLEHHLPSANMLWEDNAANGADPKATKAVRKGKSLAYVNSDEDAGSISLRSPRQHFQTWQQSVLKNPQWHSVPEARAAASGENLVFVNEDSPVPSRFPGGLTGSTERYFAEGEARTDYDKVDLRPTFVKTKPPEPSKQPWQRQDRLPGI
jgi:hypothetical protein